jgi:hypothetical protein
MATSPADGSAQPNPIDVTNLVRDGCRVGGRFMATGERFERHRQPWRQDEIQKLHQLAGKGMSLRAIAKALTRTEESVKDRAKADRLTITKMR